MSAARRSRGRQVDGILLLDKPEGWSSNQALQWAKRLFQARKAGHTGSLDPIATGLLPLCFGEATKFSSWLLDADKQYRVTARLGVTTDTLDRDGEVTATVPVPELQQADIEALLAGHFSGQIEQVPPMFSALKRDGVPLYKLAREGREVKREPRPVTVHGSEVLRLEGNELELELRVSKGTYVRTLVDDLGRLLGCGAHVSELRRTAVGGFAMEGIRTMDELQVLADADDGFVALDAQLLPVDAALDEWPEVRLTPLCTHSVQQGNPVRVPDLPDAQFVRLRGDDGDCCNAFFLGVGEILGDGRVAPRRLVRSPA